MSTIPRRQYRREQFGFLSSSFEIFEKGILISYGTNSTDEKIRNDSRPAIKIWDKYEILIKTTIILYTQQRNKNDQKSVLRRRRRRYFGHASAVSFMALRLNFNDFYWS